MSGAGGGRRLLAFTLPIDTRNRHCRLNSKPSPCFLFYFFCLLCRSFPSSTSSTSSESTIGPENGSGKLFEGKTSLVEDHLAKNYSNAWGDFYPSKAGCVFKSGPSWKVREGLEEQGIRREARTVCRPGIAPVWPATLKRIIDCLDNLGVDLTCINPLAWANEGEEVTVPFCPLLLEVGVKPRSLAYAMTSLSRPLTPSRRSWPRLTSPMLR